MSNVEWPALNKFVWFSVEYFVCARNRTMKVGQAQKIAHTRRRSSHSNFELKVQYTKCLRSLLLLLFAVALPIQYRKWTNFNILFSPFRAHVVLLYYAPRIETVFLTFDISSYIIFVLFFYYFFLSLLTSLVYVLCQLVGEFIIEKHIRFTYNKNIMHNNGICNHFFACLDSGSFFLTLFLLSDQNECGQWAFR